MHSDGGSGCSEALPSARPPLALRDECNLRVRPKDYPSDTSAKRQLWTILPLLVTSNQQAQHFVRTGNFATWDAYLLNQRTVLTIFHPDESREANSTTPSADLHNVPRIVTTRIGLQACGANADTIDGCTRYSTPKGNPLLMCPVKVKVPALYGGTLASARATRFPTFCGLRNAEYVVTTKWSTLPMLGMPIFKRFDFWVRVDYDVCFHERVDPIQRLVDQQGYFFHSGIVNDPAQCTRTLSDFVQLFSMKNKCPTADDWKDLKPLLHDSSGILSESSAPKVFFSNFIGGWVPFWTSSLMLRFAESWHSWDGMLPFFCLSCRTFFTQCW